MKIQEYIEKCLSNTEFRHYWDEDLFVESITLEDTDESAIWEALNTIDDDELQNIITNGYIKKSQKLDKQEFARAKKYRDNHIAKLYNT